MVESRWNLPRLVFRRPCSKTGVPRGNSSADGSERCRAEGKREKRNAITAMYGVVPADKNATI